MDRVRIGTRASALAKWQTEEIVRRWRALRPSLAVEVVDLSTPGDAWAEAPLERMEGTGFFTSTLESALLRGVVDVAVHSYKDLPVAATPGLAVAAVPERGPVEDVLCARDRARLADLPSGARVGTSSPRRSAQLLALRHDLECVPLRGNVPTRLRRVEEGTLDAVLVARAGVERLGFAYRITEVFTLDLVLTAPAQGALAVQARAGDAALLAELSELEDPATRRAVEAERAVLHALRGGCSVPVGAYARADGDSLRLEAGVFGPGGRPLLRVSVEGEDPVSTGAEAARRLWDAGADEILAAHDRRPRLAWQGQP